MKIICTTVVRAAKQGDIHGGLYVVDIDSEEVVHYAPYQEDFINDNERGGERGLRGIAVLDDRIVVSDSSGFIELDKKDFSVRKTHKNQDVLKSVHEICFFSDSIWATSTAHDAVASFDMNYNLTGFWQINGHNEEHHKVLDSKQRITPEQKTYDDHYHINSICHYDGRLMVSGLLTGLYDFNDMSTVLPMPYISGGALTDAGLVPAGVNVIKSASFIHNLYEYEDVFMANLTSFSCLGIATKQLGGVYFDIAPIPPAKDVKFCVDDIAVNNWNRGLARKDNLVFIGSSPARILVYDLNTCEFIKEIQLEKDMRHAIHGLEVLG
jgi:hypothetical protein|tara:strand:- start:3163 stop:4134 length:972 start_codon:yes stop_codon:yes gene_type:complete